MQFRELVLVGNPARQLSVFLFHISHLRVSHMVGELKHSDECHYLVELESPRFFVVKLDHTLLCPAVGLSSDFDLLFWARVGPWADADG